MPLPTNDVTGAALSPELPPSCTRLPIRHRGLVLANCIYRGSVSNLLQPLVLSPAYELEETRRHKSARQARDPILATLEAQPTSSRYMNHVGVIKIDPAAHPLLRMSEDSSPIGLTFLLPLQPYDGGTACLPAVSTVAIASSRTGLPRVPSYLELFSECLISN